MTLNASTAAPHPDDTIVAVSTAPGPGVRAVVRLSGPQTRAVVETVFRPGVTGPPHFLIPGELTLTDLHSPLPADLYFFPGPRSYTGQDVAELHTVGSPPLVERLVADLLTAGARPARPGEFTLRAFLAGKKNLPQAEAVRAVIEAGTDDDLNAALAQLAGGVTRPLEAVRSDLLNLLADVEAGLDFVDDDIEFAGREDSLLRISAAVAQLTNLRRQLDARAVSGRAVRAALVGAPNAGKSSLFNALAGGPAALVSPAPGTTRDYLTNRLDLGGVAVELVDTAGWQDAADTIEAQAQRLGREQATRADVVLWCAEPGAVFAAADAARLARAGAVVLRVATKCDLAGRGRDRPEDATPVGHAPGPTTPSSVVTPNGTDAVRAALAAAVAALARPPLAPSQSRCRHHVDAAIERLREAHQAVLFEDPAEILALALRAALDQLGIL